MSSAGGSGSVRSAGSSSSVIRGTAVASPAGVATGGGARGNPAHRAGRQPQRQLAPPPPHAHLVRPGPVVQLPLRIAVGRVRRDDEHPDQQLVRLQGRVVPVLDQRRPLHGPRRETLRDLAVDQLLKPCRFALIHAGLPVARRQASPRGPAAENQLRETLWAMENVGQAELLDAAGQGRILDGGGRCVAAPLLRRCCLEFRDRIDPRGLRLHRVAVRGPVDLAGLTVPFPVRFTDCEFDAPVHLEGAKLRELTLTGCPRLPGLLGNGLRLRGDLDLSGSTVTGAHRTSASLGKRAAIWLCEARIGGRVLCLDTVIRAEGERALQADRIRVGGPIRLLHAFASHGQFRLTGAHIGGSLDIIGGRIEAPGAIALDLGDAVIGGNLFIADGGGHRPVIRGRVDIGSAHISGQSLFRNATLEGSDSMPADRGHAGTRVSGTAMSGVRLTVGAEVALEGNCDVTGGLDLSMSDLSSLVVSPECSLKAAGRTALDLSNAELRSALMMSGVPVAGTIRLSAPRLHGQLPLSDPRLSQPERSS